MLAEGLHCSADTINAARPRIGVRLSSKPPDARHPFGYGAERYFWSFVSAVGGLASRRDRVRSKSLAS
jgi:divalent metal cation (Fe/Co/Zn/Cd) transporter